MERKTIWKRIVVSILALALMFSDVSVASYSNPGAAEPEAVQETQQAGEETSPEKNGEILQNEEPEGAIADDTMQPEDLTISEGNQPSEEETALAPEKNQPVAGQEEPAAAESYEGSLEERAILENTPMSQAAAATWPGEAIAAPFNDELVSAQAEVTEPEADRRLYKFNAYYVGQNDFRNVTMRDAFSLKYQMEFRAESRFEEKEIMIRIPRALVKNRDGSPVSPAEIGVPEVKLNEGQTLADLEGKESRTTSFNYYVEKDASGEEYLVFFNYRDIPEGTNSAWQVLYRNVDVTRIKDLTTWSIQPELSLKMEQAEGEVAVYQPAATQPAPLTGTVDTYVEITNVVKSPYRDKSLSHTPGLYTEKQVARYCSQPVGNLDFEKYVYVVWNVKVNGRANQPWNLYVEDIPFITQGRDPMGNPVTAEGQVIGYKNISPNYPIASGGTLDGQSLVMSRGWTKWELQFYVVTAYPKDQMIAEITENGKPTGQFGPNNTLENTLRVEVVGSDYDHPEDPNQKDPNRESQDKSSSSKCEYEEYNWTYLGNELNVGKNGSEELTGWLKIYDVAGKERGEGYGGISSSTSSHYRGYNVTYPQKEGGLNTDREYVPGRAYELTTLDDLMYAKLISPIGLEGIDSPVLLDQNDYYYSSVQVAQKDIGYDIWEDQETLPEAKGEIDRDVYIWAMFAKGTLGENTAADPKDSSTWKKDDSGNVWELVAKVDWNTAVGGSVTYNFLQEQIDREPYRVMVVHKATDYRTECEIQKNLVIKKDSKLRKILAAYEEQNDQNQELQIELQEFSGVWGTWYQNGTVMQEFYNGSGHKEEGIKYADYPGLLEASNKICKNLGQTEAVIKPYRGVQKITVTDLIGESYADKTSKAVNDAENQQILVDYNLTAYNGYKIYSQEALNYLRSTDAGAACTPGHEKVVFYDLLPYGMHFDRSGEVKAGRITNLENENYKKEPMLWNFSQVSVGAKDIFITPNWRGTGRTMVEIHVSYSGADAAEYSKKLWAEGWGVSFRAYYDWQNFNVVNTETNICAFMPDAKRTDEKDYKPLRGVNPEVVADDGSLPGNMAESARKNYQPMLERDPEDESGNGGIDGVAYNKTLPSVVFAQEKAASDGYAGSGEVNFEKRIYTSEDQILPEKSATITPESTYLYNLAVSVNSGSMTDVVIFDCLEEAVESKDHTWKGQFRAVVTTGMEKLGIRPEVYYWLGDLEGYQAEMQKLQTESDLETNQNSKLAMELLAQGDASFDPAKWQEHQTWVSRSSLENAKIEGYEERVLAIAVALKNQETDDSYVLEQGTEPVTVNLQIRMQAPSIEALQEKYPEDANLDPTQYFAYNNAQYFAEIKAIDGETKTELNVCETVKANLAPCGSLEVIKQLEGEVPAGAAGTSFRFRLYWDDTDQEGNSVKRGAGRKEYKIYKKIITDNGDVRWEEQTARLYQTDVEGYFYLRPDEKAVFEQNLPNAEDIKVSEEAGLFWKSYLPEHPTKVSEEGFQGYRITAINQYRTVLFVQKSLEGVPGSAAGEVKDQEFRFRISVKKKGETEFRPLSLAEFYYVDRASSFGEIKGQENLGAAGTFEMRADQVAALFFDSDTAEYKLEEIGTVEDASGTVRKLGTAQCSWICGESYNTRTGLLRIGENRAVISNYYRYKELYLTKTIENQEDPASCTEGFRFQLVKLEDNQEKEAGGYSWRLQDASGNPVLDENGNQVTGPIGADGFFECQCGGKTVVIEGLPLDVGKTETTYMVREIRSPETQDTSKYEPVKDAAEVTLHSMNDSGRAEIINSYLYRNLSVNKVVLPRSAAEGEETEAIDLDRKFTMKVEVAGSALANKDYTLTGSNGEEVKPSSEEYEEETFNLEYDAGNQGISAAEDIAAYVAAKRMIGQTTETAADGTLQEVYFYHTNGEGELWLKASQTAVFKDAGKRGETYGVSEIQDADYMQVLTNGAEAATVGEYGPATEGEFASGENAAVTIVNGGNDYLMLRKEFVGVNNGGKAALLLAQNGAEVIFQGGRTIFTAGLTLKVKGADGDSYEDWPKETTNVLVLDQNGDLVREAWHKKGESIQVGDGRYATADGTYQAELGQTILVPKASLEGVESYILGEADADKDRLITFMYNIKRMVSRSGMLLNIRQKEGEEYARDLAKNPAAVLCNEVEGITIKGSGVGKDMIMASEPVPVGAKLVWRLEQYQEGRWVPAQGVRYVSGQWGAITFKNTSLDIYMMEKLAATDQDGRIVLEKSADKTGKGTDWYPMIWFLEAKAYLNLYEEDSRIQEGAYRLVEAPEDEEYDRSWGWLVGYSQERDQSLSHLPEPDSGIEDENVTDEMLDELINLKRSRSRTVSAAASQSREGANAQQYGYGMISTLNGKQNMFYNSNRTTFLDVEKQMESGSAQPFTMVLKHVVSAEEGEAGRIIPKASEGAARIPYRLYYSDGVPVDEEEHFTGADGTFTLWPGQYARLELPDNTYWTVEEQLGSGYKRPVLKSDSAADDNVWLLAQGEGEASEKMCIRAENVIPVGQVKSLLLDGIVAFTPEQAKNLTKEDFYIGIPMSDGTVDLLDPEEYEIVFTSWGSRWTLEEWKAGLDLPEDDWETEPTYDGSYGITLVWQGREIELTKAYTEMTMGGEAGDLSRHFWLKAEGEFRDDGTLEYTGVFRLTSQRLEGFGIFPEKVDSDSVTRVMGLTSKLYQEDSVYDGMISIVNGIASGTFSGADYQGRNVELYFEQVQNPYISTRVNRIICPFIDPDAFAGCKSVKIYVPEAVLSYYRTRYQDTKWEGIQSGKVEFLPYQLFNMKR